MSRTTAILGSISLAVAGLLAGFAFSPAARAWSATDLPPGWTVDHITQVGATTCPSAYRIRTTVASVFSNPLCEDSPTYQQDFDAFVAAHYTAPVTTTSPTTTAATTTDTTATTTDTTQTTSTDPPASPEAVPTVATVTNGVDAATIAALQAQIDALRTELRQLVCLLQMSPTLDPGILAALMSLEPGCS